MTLWTSLEPASATVDPGSSTTVRLRLRNTGDIVEEYRFEPVGPVAPWTTVEPATLRLYPGTTGTVELTFAPPRTPDATAGPNPYAVRITPTEHPDEVTVPEGVLTVTPFSELRAELVPPTVKGRFRGRPRLAVDNLGNSRLTASISGTDNGENLAYELRPGNVQIEPGRAAFVDATLRPRQIIWFGSSQQRPYSMLVRRSGVPPLTVDGTFVQRGFLPRWLMTALSLVVALGIAFVALWLAYKPPVSSKATEKQVVAGSSTLPSPPPSKTAEPPKDDSPSQPPAGGSGQTTPPAAGGGGSGGSGGGGGGGGSKGGGGGGGSQHKPAPGVLIIGDGSNRCIDATSQGKDGTQLQIRDCNGSDSQKWDFRPDGTVRSLGYCMDVAWGSSDDGAHIQIARCSGNPAQTFVMSGAGDLVNPQANKCVDVSGNVPDNGTKLQLWTCNGVPGQKWHTKG